MAHPSRIAPTPGSKSVICRFWMQGKCNRNPCRFEHGDAHISNVYLKTSRLLLDSLENGVRKFNDVRKTHKRLLVSKASNAAGFGSEAAKRSNTVGSIHNVSSNVPENLKRKPPGPKNGVVSTIVSDGSKEEVAEKIVGRATNEVNLKKTEVVENDPCNSVVLATENPDVENRNAKNTTEVCELWMSSTCEKGDKCLNLHSRFYGEGFSMLAELRGHNQAISGITFPTGSDKLYSSSGDGIVQIWNCHTGQSSREINLGNKIGSLISEGPWLFAGMPSLVKAMNTATAIDYDLLGPVGQVSALAVVSDMLFAGAQDGAIAVWKGSRENPCPFKLETFLNGHSGAVICFAVEGKKLFSGSMDGTIKVWDLDTLQLHETLNGHTDAVMSLVCWNGHLMSCSLDQTIKVWYSAEGKKKFENVYTHNEEHGVLNLCGINDAENKPILLCSCNDNSVHLYDLPTFNERGRLFSKQQVRTIKMGPGLFFTGDGSGLVTVWKIAKKKVEETLQKSSS